MGLRKLRPEVPNLLHVDVDDDVHDNVNHHLLDHQKKINHFDHFDLD